MTAIHNPITYITDFSAEELDIYARYSEVQLYNYPKPGEGIFIAESPIVIERALDAGYEPVSLLLEEKHIETKALPILNRYPDLPVYTAEFSVLKQLTGFPLTRGALCAMKRKPLKTLEEICRNAKRIAILEDIMNPTNIGAIFRSAAALNIDAVILTSASSDPLYRRAIRVSMGNVFLVPWTVLPKEEIWPEQGLLRLKELGFQTAAMALSENSISIADPRLRKAEKLAIILGTEGDGLTSKTISDADYVVRIPMTHGVDSLNVAAASAVAFWELGKSQITGE